MKKKILFMSSAKLTAISIGLLLAVFCTIGMSFRPVYDEQEASEIVMSGPRRSHWTTTSSWGCTTHHNKTDYARTVAQSLNVAYGTVEITAKSKGSDPDTAADGSQSYVDWDTGIGSSETTDELNDLEAIHTNTFTFTATPTDPEEYYFVGWYSDEGGTTLVSGEGESSWEKSVKFDSKYYTYSSSHPADYESSRWTVTYYAKFAPIPAINVTFLAASTPARDNGYYTVAGKGVSETITTSNQTIGVKGITLTAYASEMAEFVRWYTEDGAGNRTTLSEENPCVTSFTAATKVGVEWRELTNHHKITFLSTDVDANGDPVGSYTVDAQTVNTSNYVYNTGDAYKYSPTLTATPASDYIFTGWYTKHGKKKDLLSTSNPWNPTFTQDSTIYAGFAYNNYTDDQKAQFKVGSTYYTDLNAANSAAGSNGIIICTRDGILPPGNYTISSGVKLYIPYSTSETSQTVPKLISKSAPALSPYRKLIMVEGANINCNGTICVGGQITSMEGGSFSGYPVGACGILDMSKGGHIELNDGAVLYAWGFIKGQDMDQGNNTIGAGTITANSGAKVYEDFSGENRGGSACSALAQDGISLKSFPFQGYTIQNIEVPVTYKFGSTLQVYTALYIRGDITKDFPLISSANALFLLKNSRSIVTKWYDPTSDLACYQLSGTAQLDAINTNIYVSINSADFNLPISSNMHIILDDCNMTLSNPIQILPDAIIEIRDNATVTLASNLFLYDVDDWKKGVASGYFAKFNNLTSHKDRGAVSSKEMLSDAKLIVDGTLNVTGKIYSTAGGANICGNDGGKIIYPSTLTSSSKIYQCWGAMGGSQTYEGVECANTYSSITGTKTYVHSVDVNTANLHNEDDSYTKSIASTTFHNVNGRWFAASAKDEKANHTYDFTYISSGAVSGTSGTDLTTDAVYSNDKTGLEARMKWFNVTSDCSGEDEEHVMHYWWKDANDYFYNWTMLSAWHQFIPTETEGLYSGSNNKLYTKTDVSTTCTWSELGETDVNCLYTIEDTKKALVNGHFIALEPNSDDAAFHEAADPTKYYICFEGCNWHAATKYEGEKKAYVVDETTFIWYEERWMAVEREEPFFYTKDETNVTIYYEYIGSEWVLAQPYVEVTDATETRQLLRFNEAITVASAKKNVTIKLLRDLVNITTPMTFTGANTTCTLDLNGHTAEVQVTGDGTTAVNMLTLNGAGSTFTITDNTAEKKGELKLVTSFTTENNTKRWRGIYLQNGSLVMANGKLHVENPIPYTKSTKLGYIEGILVASGKTLTINGGTIEVKSAYNPYGIETASGTPTVTINGGILETVATTNDSPYGIIGYGTINIKGGEVRAIASGSSSSRGVSVSAGSSYQGTVNVTGGTIYSEATGSAQGIYCGGTATVTGDYNATTPNNTPKARYYAKANISGGTITAVCRTSTSSFGVLSYGTTTISGGTITSTVQKSNQNTAYGVCTRGGTTTISAGANITANAPTTAYGVTATAANGDSNRGWPHVGVVNITGGTITANTTNTTTAYGLLVTGTTWTINLTNSYKVFNGDYAAAGTATVTGGTFKANAKTTLACGIAVAATKTKNDASATPQCTINGGYYQMTGTGDVLGCNASALAADFHINGGYYSHDGNLATYTPSPKHVLTLAAGDANRPPYYYKVAEAYQVTFKSEDGTANIIDPVYQEVNTKPVCSTEPTKASNATNSFTFDGWATEANGNKVYEPDGLPNVTSAGATYYAHFATTTLKYRVHFDAVTNGGDCATENFYVDPGTAVGTLPTATKYGYTFNGWFTAASGGKQLTASTVINADADYYAQFTVNSHTLTWDLAGGTVGTAGKIGSTTWPAKNVTGTQSRSVAYGTVLTTIPVVTKAGYVFNRWDPVPTSSMPDNNVTFTALWNPATNTKYYVKHYQQNIDDDNYTLVETDNLTGTTGATVTPDRKSYDGFLTPGPQQLTIGAAGTTELAYYYDRVVYTINWNASANGGACATTSTDVRHGANIALPAATKAGHIFDGWYTKAEGGNKISEEATILQNYGTLYAQFVPTYTIIWNDENGNELSREEKLIGESLTPPDYSKTNTAEWTYTFHGWNDGTTTYAANAIPAVSGAATYTADVTKVKNNYTLTIGVVEAGYGSVNETSVTVPYGTSVSTSDNVLTIGTTTVTATPTAQTAQYTYAFDHWNNVPATVTEAATIQAVFTRSTRSYNVTFNMKDHGSAIDGQTKEYGSHVDQPSDPSEEGYTFVGWYKEDACTNAWDFDSDVVEDNTTLYAKWTAIKYKITWWDAQETLENHVIAVEEYEYGEMPSYTYNKPNDYAYSYEVIGWTPNLEQVTADKTYTALYYAIPLTLVVNNEQTIENNVTLNSTTVRVSGALRVAPSASLTTTDLILEASAENSGEITGNVQLNPGGHAYFDLYINDTEPRHWHAFSVPFQIDLRKAGNPIQINGETLTLGSGYDILFYDGAVRAEQGKVADCWKYVEDGDSILYPGKAYMIASASRAIVKVRFTKADLAPIAFSGTINVTGGSGVDGGWNGIGNPTTYHAIMDAGPKVAQVHNGGKIGADGYTEYNIENLKYVVGKAVYVQVIGSGQSVDITHATVQGVITPKAPARRNTRADINKEYLSLDDYYKVSIAQENSTNTCNVYVLDEEDKEDAYVIGHDLSKFGLNTALLQMWVNRYDNQLSLNTTAPVDGVAYYPLGINAPKAGEYTISLQSWIDDEHALYLTYDGEAVWNLSDGAFSLYLEKGTTSRYGLRLVEKAPHVATGTDEAVVDAQGETQKVLINDHVYIIRGNNIYTIDGQLVK